MTSKHSEINIRILIRFDKNINGMAFDFEYIIIILTRFIEVYNTINEHAKYVLTKFGKYMIKLIVDGELQDWRLEPQLIGDNIIVGATASIEKEVSDEEVDKLQDIQTLRLENIGCLWD